MGVDRRTARIAVPAAVTLALLTGMTGPLAAAQAPPAPSAGERTAIDLGPATTTDHAASPLAGGSPVMDVSVSVPPLVLARAPTIVDGHLRTPVLLTVPGAKGRAFVPGAAGCSTRLTAGEVAWVDCDVARTDRRLTLVVTTTSGASVRAAIAL